MKIAHLKRSKKELKERREEMSKPMTPGDEEYPYGTRVRLENEEMDKVGLSKPKVGDHYEIRGHAKVIGAHESADEHGPRRHVELHITHMGAKKAEGKSIREEIEDAADKKSK